MRLKIILLLSVLSICFKVADAQTITWRQIFGGPYVDIGRNCIELRNGGYLMIGEKEIIIPPSIFFVQKSYLVKFDQYGNILWEKVYK